MRTLRGVPDAVIMAQPALELAADRKAVGGSERHRRGRSHTAYSAPNQADGGPAAFLMTAAAPTG
eukprot:9708662-Heterocapsa_arctica.AAC.1